jgi:hypothetical protein
MHKDATYIYRDEVQLTHAIGQVRHQQQQSLEQQRVTHVA